MSLPPLIRACLFPLLLPLLLCLPAMLRGEYIGSPGGELYGHAWMQGLAARSWPMLPQVEAWTTAGGRPAIDPIQTWICGGLARWIGSAGGPVAWNGMVLAGLVLAGHAGVRLCRALIPPGADARTRRLAEDVGMVSLQTAPIFLGSITSGLTEDLGWGLAILAVADLLEGRRWRGAILLGLSAGTGLYTAWMGGIVATGLGIWRIVAAARGGRGALLRQAAGWAGAGLLAGGIALGIASPHLGRILSAEAGQAEQRGPPPRTEPLWRLNPWQGADIASFVVPGKQPAGEAMVREHPAWIGVALPGLALYGLSGGLSGGIGPLHLIWPLVLGMSVGPAPMIAGEPIPAPNPLLTALRWLPGASNLHHHARLLLLAEPILLALALPGLLRLAGSRPGAARWLPVIIAADHLLLSAARLPLPGTPATSPAIYAELEALPPGPLAVVGASGPGVHPQKVFFDQLAHGRRLLLDPDRPVPLRRVPAGSVLVVLGPPESRPRMEETARRGPPAASTPDGAAWIVP